MTDPQHRLRIKVETLSHRDTDDLIGELNAGGDTVSASAELVDRQASRGFGFGEFVVLALGWGGAVALSVSTSVFASWLYEKLKKRARSVEMDGRVYQITEEEIRQLVEEAVRQAQAASGKDPDAGTKA